MAIVMVLSVTLLITLIILLEVKKYFINQRLRGFKPIKGVVPILGAALRVLGTSNTSIIDELFKMFDEVKSTSFRIWAGWKLVILTYDPKTVEILLTNEHCLNKPYFYQQFHVDTSIIVVDKNKWKIQRRALNSAFGASALQAYVPLLNKNSRILINRIEPYVNERCDVYRSIFIGMLDIVTRTLMGVDMRLQSDRGESMYTVINQHMDCIMYRIVRVWLRWNFVYYNFSKVGRAARHPLINDFVNEIYKEKPTELKIQQSKCNNLQEINRSDVNNVLEKCFQLERDGIFSDENVLDNIRMILVAAIDTSAITVFSTLLMLAMNQKHQELVIDELRSIFETPDCDVTQSHLAAMEYTERVIKESMRLFPPGPVIARQLTADVEFPNGTLPKGTIVAVSIMHMHRNPEVWGENVLEFDPDRFLPENVAKRPPFSYIPFSAGPRNCIGMKYAMLSAKTVLAHLLRRYKFSTDLKFDEIEMSTHLVLHIKNEKPLRVERRNF